MHDTSASPARLNAQQRSAHIRAVVMEHGAELRARYPILRHQDAIGVGILLFALTGMIASAALYIGGYMAWWVCLLLNGFFASLTHELEHDLIHSMYFRKQRIPHNLMLALVWLARPSTINPWIRRHLHLNHHKVSGTEADMEERAITNGEPWGLARLLMVGDNVMSALIRMLREAGAAAVHVRIASPPVKWPCFYGIDFASPGELIANAVTSDNEAEMVQSVCTAIGADSLGFVSTQSMVEATKQSRDELCCACFDGVYPLGLPAGNPNAELVSALQRGSCGSID